MKNCFPCLGGFRTNLLGDAGADQMAFPSSLYLYTEGVLQKRQVLGLDRIIFDSSGTFRVTWPLGRDLWCWQRPISDCWRCRQCVFNFPDYTVDDLRGIGSKKERRRGTHNILNRTVKIWCKPEEKLFHADIKNHSGLC